MNKCDLSKIKLIDIIKIPNVSIRLSNCLLAASENLDFPIDTVIDFLNAGSHLKDLFLRKITNMGLKSFNELDKLISIIVEINNDRNVPIDSISISPTEKQQYKAIEELLDRCGQEPKGESEFINDDIVLLSLSDVINLNVTSVRLRNSILSAEKSHKLPFSSVGDYLKEGENASRKMLSISNFGKNTANEFDTLMMNIVNHNNIKVSLEGEEVDQLFKDSDRLDESNGDAVEILLNKFRNYLTDREFNVLTLRAINNKTLQEIGFLLDVTRERIRQVEKKTIYKLLNMFTKVFKRIAIKIDSVLEEFAGEVELSVAAENLNLTPELLKLLVYICKEQCVHKVKVKADLLMYSFTEEYHSDWNEIIDDTLSSLSWPISLSAVYHNIQDLPDTYIKRYLINKKGAVFNGDKVVQFNHISQTLRMIFVLREAGKGIHTSEIARKYKELFFEEIQEHNAASIVGRMEEALIVDRGIYALYETLNTADSKIVSVRNISYEYIFKKKDYVSSKVLYKELFQDNNEFLEINNPHIIHGILQDDTRFVFRRGFMVGIEDHVGIVEFSSLTSEVLDIVKNKGPISVSQIKAELSSRRNVLLVAITKIMEASGDIVKISLGNYDTVKNVFGEQDLFDQLKLAVTIALFNCAYGTYELVSNLRALKLFDEIDINKAMIAFLLNNMKGVIKEGERYIIHSVHSVDSDVEAYSKIVNDFVSEQKNINEVLSEVEDVFGYVKAEKYMATDFRLKIPGFNKASSTPITSNDNAIGSILSAFEI